jgi:chromosome segregation ATPase
MSEDLTKKLTKSDRDAILTAINNLETRISSVDSRMQGVEQKVDHLEQTVQQRLHDTRPICHRLVADIGELQAGQQRLEKGQEAMRADLSELNTAVRNVNRDQIVINDVIRKIQLDFHIIDERLHRLEVNRNPSNSST